MKHTTVAIESDPVLSPYGIGAPREYPDDGTIGIPFCVTVFYDRSRGTSVPGFATRGATPLMIYVVNTNTARIGTKSDAAIVKSMLDRGYIVLVLDYKNNEKAVSPALENSVQRMIEGIKNGEYFPDDAILRKGTYSDTLVVPSGCDVLLNAVYFELDKHGTDGTLEKIVNVWNNDFRKFKKDMAVRWVRKDGSRKPVRDGIDGSRPVWYADAELTVEDAGNGQYTRIGYTKAEEITDCVREDGTPIDLKLRYDLIYPTRAEKDVPVVLHFSSTQYLPEAVQRTVRPQFTGFLFSGYACAVFDYAYIPMCRNDHYGYFDGSSGDERSVTGYNPIFSTYVFNAAQVSTAAVRFVRYLSLSDHPVYRFDVDRIGVFGVSKTSFVTHLGAPYLRENLLSASKGQSEEELAEAIEGKLGAFYQWMYLPGHHGETRRAAGKTKTYTKDGFTVAGGEVQPWTTWKGKEVPSGATVVYSSCGATLDYIGEGYAPVFTTVNLRDGYRSGYLQQNTLVNLLRVHNVPSFWAETDLDHTRLAIGTDLHHGVDLYRALFGFFGYYLMEAPPAVLWTEPANDCGAVDPARPVTVKFIGEIPACEIEKISLKGTEGKPVPGRWVASYGNTEWTFLHVPFAAGERITLTVPAALSGSNGKPLGRETVAAFEVGCAAPARPAVFSGAGTVYEERFEKGFGDFEKDPRATYETASVDGVLAGKITLRPNDGEFGGDHVFYEPRVVLKNEKCVFGGKPLSEKDLGRTLRVTVRLFDTVSRQMRLYLKCLTDFDDETRDTGLYRHRTAKFRTDEDYTKRLRDYRRAVRNLQTKPNEWCEFTLDYTVYEPAFGKRGEYAQTVYLLANPDGDRESPFYIGLFKVEEIRAISTTDADAPVYGEPDGL